MGETCGSAHEVQGLGVATCAVDWTHVIHCGYVGKVRVRWTDDGTRPSDDELREWDARFEARSMSASRGTVMP